MMWLFGQFSDKQQADTAYSYTQFVEAVEAGEVLSAKVSQNKEIPTGKVVFTLENGEQKNTNLSDVNKAEEIMQMHDVEVTFGDVEEENYLMTIGLPMLLSLQWRWPTCKASPAFLIFLPNTSPELSYT